MLQIAVHPVRISRLVLCGLVVILVAAHLGVFSISTHSAQIAIPYMMNRGRVLFGDLLEQHAPAVSVISAAAQRMLPFFDPLTIVRLLHLITISLLMVAVYAIAAGLSPYGERAGLVAALVLFLWQPVYGNILFYFDSLLGLYLILSCLFILNAGDRRWLWIVAGLAAGMATLAKQHAWGAVIILALWVWFCRKRGCVWFLAGVVAPPLLTLLTVALNGTLDTYLYWNWTFNLSGLMDSAAPKVDFVRKLLLSNCLVPLFLWQAWRTRRVEWRLIGALWLAACATMLPRFADVHAQAHLPFAAIATGIIVLEMVHNPAFAPFRRAWTRRTLPRLIGLTTGAAVITFGWVWSTAVPYVPVERRFVPAHDEFRPIADYLRSADSAATLFVLPETDSTPQIHALTGLLPPRTWIKGWNWYFEAPGITARLLDEWERTPPTFVVVFPDMLIEGQPGIAPLVAFVEAHYDPVTQIPDIRFHGDALIYRVRER